MSNISAGGRDLLHPNPAVTMCECGEGETLQGCNEWMRERNEYVVLCQGSQSRGSAPGGGVSHCTSQHHNDSQDGDSPSTTGVKPYGCNAWASGNDRQHTGESWCAGILSSTMDRNSTNMARARAFGISQYPQLLLVHRQSQQHHIRLCHRAQSSSGHSGMASNRQQDSSWFLPGVVSSISTEDRSNEESIADTLSSMKGSCGGSPSWWEHGSPSSRGQSQALERWWSFPWQQQTLWREPGMQVSPVTPWAEAPSQWPWTRWPGSAGWIQPKVWHHYNIPFKPFKFKKRVHSHKAARRQWGA